MLRVLVFCLLFVAGWTALDNLDKWGHAELLKQEQAQQKLVPCDTDSDCMEKNPHIKEE